MSLQAAHTKAKPEPVQLSIDEAFELVRKGYRFQRAKPSDEVLYRINGQIYGAECIGRCATMPDNRNTTA
jgi:hypothetical protein